MEAPRLLDEASVQRRVTYLRELYIFVSLARLLSVHTVSIAAPILVTVHFGLLLERTLYEIIL